MASRPTVQTAVPPYQPARLTSSFPSPSDEHDLRRSNPDVFPHSASSLSIAQSSPSDVSLASPLFKLPRELRDRIYAYALVSNQAIWWPCAKFEHGINLALLSTSRAIYREATEVLYRENRFMFLHPSDANMFRHTMSPAPSASLPGYPSLITTLCFRIRDRDVRIWTGYLGSTMTSRSLLHDFPNLRHLWIFYRSGGWAQPQMQLQAQQHLHQHQWIQAQQQVQQQGQIQQPQPPGQPQPAQAQNALAPPGPLAQLAHAQGAGPPAPPPPASAAFPPHPQTVAPNQPPGPTPQAQHALNPTATPFPASNQPPLPGQPPNAPLLGPVGAHQGHTAPPTPDLLRHFGRWQHDLKLKEICHCLEGKTPAEVRLIAVHSLRREDVASLVAAFPEQLFWVGRDGRPTASEGGSVGGAFAGEGARGGMGREVAARTKFARIGRVDCALELAGVEGVQG